MARNLLNLLIYVMLGLIILMIVGMLIASWRMVLYPFLLVAGICILFGLTRAMQRNRGMLLLPIGLVTLLVALYGWLDSLSVADPDGEGLVLGFAPTTALYFFGIMPAFLLISLAFSLTFSQDAPELEEGAQVQGSAREGNWERSGDEE